MLLNPYKRYESIVRHRGELAHFAHAVDAMAAAARAYYAGLERVQADAECFPAPVREQLAEALRGLEPEVFERLVAVVPKLNDGLQLALETAIAERRDWPDPNSDEPPER